MRKNWNYDLDEQEADYDYPNKKKLRKKRIETKLQKKHKISRNRREKSVYEDQEFE